MTLYSYIRLNLLLLKMNCFLSQIHVLVFGHIYMLICAIKILNIIINILYSY